MTFRIVLLYAFLLPTIALFSQPADVQRIEPMVSQGFFLGDIPALRDLTPHTQPAVAAIPKKWQRKNYFGENALNNPDPLPRDGDPLAKKSGQTEFTGPQITPLLNFEGLRDNGVVPPDPTGDIGKDHYMQMINSNGNAWFQIWKKNGDPAYGPALTSTIWSQVGSGSIGDPIVQYDPGAQRWLMMEMQGFGSNELLIAVSNTSDPTGGWKAYRFATLGFPDYPKLYVWHDAYLVTTNEIVNGGNRCSGFALEKEAILAGETDFQVYRFEMPNFNGIVYQPATGVDWEGGPPPPPGSPGYIFRVYDDSWNGGADQLQVWKVFVNWQNVNQSFLEGPQSLYTTPFETKVCWSGLFNCIEQPGTNGRITALENIIMYRAPYRNFANYESVVLNHISDVSGQVGPGGDAAVRWYELRKTPGSTDWSVYQEGTYAPDLTNRFMGTLCMDEAGNIGLGYSVASTTVFPGLRIVGRRAGDPLNEMAVSEYTLIDGGASHTTQRWGDYSNMAVDPEDGRTFWFTGEYQPAQGFFGTRIGSFRISRDTFDLTPQALIAPQPSATLGAAEQVTVQILNSGLVPASNIPITLRFQGQTVVTDVLSGPIEPGAATLHTFSSTVAMPTPNTVYNFEIIAKWPSDAFAKNDTLRAQVRKLLSNDAANAGRVDLPGLVCAAQHTYGFLLRNASGLPMQSAEIGYKLNAQPWQSINWTGNLQPGQTDTVPITLNGITNGLNGLFAYASKPNSVADENGANDTTFTKFYGNLDGAYLALESATEYGILSWELRDPGNILIARGKVEEGEQKLDICTANNTCYTLKIRATTFSWKGSLRLLDLYGNLLFDLNYATNEEQVFNFCTPTRKNLDVGALELVSPQSGAPLSAAEPVTVLFRNFGLQPASQVQVAYQVAGGAWVEETIPGPVAPGAAHMLTFVQPADLSAPATAYPFRIRAAIAGDESPANNETGTTVWHRGQRDLSLSLSMQKACADLANTVAELSLLNNGTDSILQAKILLLSNQGPADTFQLADTLAPGALLRVPVPAPYVVPGDNTLAVAVLEVNGLPEDAVIGNNTDAVQFDIDPEAAGATLFFFTDANPHQTRWELRTLSGQVLESGGPYDYPTQMYVTEWCLKTDSCYIFRMYDTGADGMEGGVVIQYKNKYPVSHFDKPFTTILNDTFCLSGVCGTLDLAASVSNESAPGAADGSISLGATGGTPPYRWSLDGVSYRQTPQFDQLAAGNYAIICLDSLDCTAVLDLVVEMAVGVQQKSTLAHNLYLSPNPTRGLLSIALDAFDPSPIARAELYDAGGRFLQAAHLYRWDAQWRGGLALDNYPPGRYWVVVRTATGMAAGQVERAP